MLNNTETDISKAVFSEGEWHIVPAEHVNSWVSKDRKSVIVHKCSLWKDVPTSEGWVWKQYGYWALAEHVDKPCKLCTHSPPAAIVQLFMLHNFDTFASDDIMSRFISKAHRFDQMMFLTGTDYIGFASRRPARKEPIDIGPDE